MYRIHSWPLQSSPHSFCRENALTHADSFLKVVVKMSRFRKDETAAQAYVVEFHACVATSLLRLEVYGVLLFALGARGGASREGWVVGDISGDASRLGHVGSKFFPKGASWFTSFDMVARFAYE